MTIRDKITQIKLRCTTELFIVVYDTRSGYNRGLFLSDLARYPVADFVPDEALDKECKIARNYTKNKARVLALGY